MGSRYCTWVVGYITLVYYHTWVGTWEQRGRSYQQVHITHIIGEIWDTGSREKTTAPINRWWAQTAKQEGDKVSEKFLPGT